jgi:hypothetical protein
MGFRCAVYKGIKSRRFSRKFQREIVDFRGKQRGFSRVSNGTSIKWARATGYYYPQRCKIATLEWSGEVLYVVACDAQTKKVGIDACRFTHAHTRERKGCYRCLFSCFVGPMPMLTTAACFIDAE